MSRTRFAVIILVGAALTACNPSADPAPQAEVPQAAPTEVSEPPINWRNLDDVRMCELIHNEEVAALFQAEPMRGDLEGATGPNCSYQVTPDGGDTVGNIFMYLYTGDMADVSMTLARQAGGEAVAGLGGEAYLVCEDAEAQFRLIGNRQGDFAFEILAHDDQGATRLAEMILERLSP
jgi:hypothetical protein